MITVGQQGGMMLPVGLGIGATQAANATMSPMRAAGRLPIITVAEPFETMPGPFGTHDGRLQLWLMLPITAAGRFLISTVGTVAPTIGSGSGGCGRGVGTGAAGWIGAWQCGPWWMTLSVWRAAGGIS